MKRLAMIAAIVCAACSASGGAPLPVAWSPPANPHLAASAWAIFHHDSYAQHWSALPGPTGKSGAPVSTVVGLDGVPVFVLFDPDENILAVTKRLSGATLWKIDRATLTPVAHTPLDGSGLFAGTYGYLDDQGRAVFGVGHSITRLLSSATSLDVDATVDLSSTLAMDDSLVAISPLYTGEIAFLSANGVVGVLAGDLAPGAVPLKTTNLTPGGAVSNGFSVDEHGSIYAVNAAGLHRVDWDGAAQTLTEAWELPVEADFTSARPGRLGIGSGTTPVLMENDSVVIADDAPSMNLMVVDRAAGTPRCKVPVFDEDAATDNAIVVTGRTMIVEQNLVTDPVGAQGLARFDLEADGSCPRAWVSPVHAPTCVPTLSTATNLVYAYSESNGDWGLTALDVRDGHTVFDSVAGSSGAYDNVYSAVTIGPDKRVYVGALIGLVVFADP
jgi:hypothetical protein